MKQQDETAQVMNSIEERIPVLTAEEKREQISKLVALGKERGYLMFSEVNDYLSDDMVGSEQIDNIIETIRGLGIQVTEVAPDAETLLMSCLLYTSPSPRDRTRSRMPSSA